MRIIWGTTVVLVPAHGSKKRYSAISRLFHILHASRVAVLFVLALTAVGWLTGSALAAPMPTDAVVAKRGSIVATTVADLRVVTPGAHVGRSVSFGFTDSAIRSGRHLRSAT